MLRLWTEKGGSKTFMCMTGGMLEFDANWLGGGVGYQNFRVMK